MKHFWLACILHDIYGKLKKKWGRHFSEERRDIRFWFFSTCRWFRKTVGCSRWFLQTDAGIGVREPALQAADGLGRQALADGARRTRLVGCARMWRASHGPGFPPENIAFVRGPASLSLHLAARFEAGTSA